MIFATGLLHLRIEFILVLVMVGCASSDLTEDRKECQDKLISLSSCLPFIGGESRAPAPACCDNLRNQISKNDTEKCLCLLVKDRNEPGLGFKVNATLALSAPSICHAPVNISDCLVLLHLAPHSADAQVFEQFINSTAANGKIAIPSSSRSFAKRRFDLEMVGGVSLWIVTSVIVSLFRDHVI